MNLNEFATEAAKTALVHAHNAGMTAERHFHNGQATVMYFEAGNTAEGVTLLRRGLAAQGRSGQRFVEGMRFAQAGITAIRAYLDVAGMETKAAWKEDAPNG